MKVTKSGHGSVVTGSAGWWLWGWLLKRTFSRLGTQAG